MKIQINIEKKHFFILLGVIVLLAGAIFVYAQTPIVPNPGHSASQIGDGTVNADVTFAKRFYSTTNDADFLSVANTNTSQNNVAIISNKEDFGVWSTFTNDWADFSARNIGADYILASGGIQIGNPASSVCTQNGNNCPVPSGLVKGGGCLGCESRWGVAVCSGSNGNIQCPNHARSFTGSRAIYDSFSGYTFVDCYVCTTP